MAAWLAAAQVASLAALVLVAAKAHGRQVRLEREAHGVWKVDFRRENDAWVEALWRRDRRTLWPTFGVLAALSVAAAAALAAQWPPSPTGAAWAASGIAASFAAAFAVAGLSSLARFVRRGEGEAAWRAKALRGSVLWWLLVAAVGGAAAALATR